MKSYIAIRKSMRSIMLTFLPVLLILTYILSKKYNFWVAVVLFLICFAILYYAISFMNRTPSIIIDDVGIHFGWPLGTINWSDMVDVHLKGYQRGGVILEMKLRNGTTRKAGITFLDLPPERIREVMLTKIRSSGS